MPSFLIPDFGLLFWTFLAFLVVFILLAKFGFPAIIKMVEDRKKFIDESLKNARTANEKLANITVESESLLKGAHIQQTQILKEAKATSESIIKEAKSKAQLEGAKILDDAKMQIDAEKENALREIRAQVASVSVQVAEKLMRQKLAINKEQSDMIERLMDEVVTPNK